MSCFHLLLGVSVMVAFLGACQTCFDTSSSFTDFSEQLFIAIAAMKGALCLEEDLRSKRGSV